MKPITFFDVLWQSPKNGKWYNQSHELTKKEVENLQGETQYLLNSRLWALLVNEGLMRAQTRAFVQADTGNDAKDLVELRKAQAYHRTVQMFEEVIRKLNSTRE